MHLNFVLFLPHVSSCTVLGWSQGRPLARARGKASVIRKCWCHLSKPRIGALLNSWIQLVFTWFQINTEYRLVSLVLSRGIILINYFVTTGAVQESAHSFNSRWVLPLPRPRQPTYNRRIISTAFIFVIINENYEHCDLSVCHPIHNSHHKTRLNMPLRTRTHAMLPPPSRLQPQ